MAWLAALTLALLWASLPAGAEAPAAKGLGFQIETEGFFANPLLKRVLVQQVGADLPPAAQVIAVGDEVIEVEGRAIVGARARAMKSLMDVPAGTPLRLRLKRPGGEIYSTTLVTRERKVVAGDTGQL